jgi:hypothetical protein
MPSKERSNQNDDGDNHNPQCNSDGSGQSGYLPPQVICAQAIKANPRNGSSYVRDQEAPPRHVIRACKEADNAAKHRNEAGEEDNFGAVAQEKILSNLDPRRVQVKIGAVPQQQPISKLTADPNAIKVPMIPPRTPESMTDQILSSCVVPA